MKTLDYSYDNLSKWPDNIVYEDSLGGADPYLAWVWWDVSQSVRISLKLSHLNRRCCGHQDAERFRKEIAEKETHQLPWHPSMSRWLTSQVSHWRMHRWHLKPLTHYTPTTSPCRTVRDDWIFRSDMPIPNWQALWYDSLRTTASICGDVSHQAMSLMEWQMGHFSIMDDIFFVNYCVHEVKELIFVLIITPNAIYHKQHQANRP